MWHMKGTAMYTVFGTWCKINLAFRTAVFPAL